MEEGKDKNFGLSNEEFAQMLIDLKSQDYTLFERIFLKQFDESIRYVRSKYSASQEDAYDATMDALIDLRNRMVTNKVTYGNLRFLFTKMATQHYVKNTRKFQFTDVEEKHIVPTADVYDQDQKIQLHNAFEKLGTNCKELLKQHLYGQMKLVEIAAAQGKSTASIRKQKERCIKKAH